MKAFDTASVQPGMRVLVRCGFDVPIGEEGLTPKNVWRVNAAVPFLRALVQQKARVIIISHRGRPRGKDDRAFSLEPIAAHLKKELNTAVHFSRSLVGSALRQEVDALEEGSVLLLENLRFHPGERGNDRVFVRELASLGEVFVNNDFATAHRAHASTVGLSTLLPAYAGPLLMREIETLERVREYDGAGLVLAIGGAKSATKLKIADRFVPRAEAILLAGVPANTVLAARGVAVGSSVVGEQDEVTDRVRDADNVIVPTDVVVSTSLERAENVATRDIADVQENEIILDIGPRTRTQFAEHLSSVVIALWNGPLGLVELPEFRAGSQAYATALTARATDTIVGGGDVVTFLYEEDVADAIGYISTGGGAMLAYLAGEELPAIATLSQKQT